MSSSVYDADCVLLAQCFSSWSSEHRSWDSPTSSPGMLPSQHSGASWLRNEALVPTWQEYWFSLMSPGPRVRQIFFFFFLHSVAPRLGKKKNLLWKCNNPNRCLTLEKRWIITEKNKEKNTDRIHFFPEVILLQSSWGLTVLQENLSTCEKQNKAEHRSLTN